jgi:hypothetical protein
MRLLSSSNEGIIKLIDNYEKETKAIKKEILKLTWFMRGALSYSEGMMLSSSDRDIITSIIDDNLKTTKETHLPFF